MKHYQKVLLNFGIALLVLSLIIFRIVKINDNDIMSTIDKENFKLLHGTIEKDYLHAAANGSDSLDYALSGDIVVTNENGPYKMTLKMGIASINYIYGIKNIDLQSDDHVLSIESDSDWLSPYMVKATDPAYKSDAVPAFTGGWHSRAPVAPSEPSAFMKSYEIYADGQKITGNATGKAKTIHIIVNQLVKGYNTNDFVLEEYILYTIINDEVRVKVKTFALKDVAIEKFYGMETQNKSFDKHVNYHFDSGPSKTLDVGINSDSGPRDLKNKLSYFSLNSNDYSFILSAYMTHVEAPRTMPLLPEGVPEAFTEAYGKSYFNIVNGNPLFLKTHEVFEWSGKLQFSKE